MVELETIMESCEYQRQLSAYHDGELPAGQAAEVERHLSECERCAGELERLRGISAFLSAASASRYVPDAAMRRWRQSVRPARDRAVLRLTEMLSAAAAAVLILCASVLWQYHARAPRPAQSESWETAAVRTASPAIRTTAGQLTGGPETPPDVQLANTILGSTTSRKAAQP